MGFWLLLVEFVLVLCVFIWIVDHFTFNLKDRYILVTGCDSGFDKLLATNLDRKGCHVFAACFTEKGAADLQSATSDRLKTVMMDVTKSESIKTAFEEVKAALPKDQGLWGVVNNAGVTGHIGQYDWWTRDEFRSIIEVNCLGVVEVCNVFLPLVKKVKGRIVNMSNTYGLYSNSLGGYEIAKYGVEAFSDGLRLNMQPFGVSVHLIEPAFFRTPLTSSENIFGKVDVAWNRLTQEQRDEYGEEYFRDYKKLMQDNFLDAANENFHLVTDAMEHALSAYWPWRRYLPGKEAKFLFKPLSMLPAMFTDNVFPLLGIKIPVPKSCQ